MFTTGIVGFSFTGLRKLSTRAEDIYKNARAKVMQDKNNYPPGLLEQYEIQLERLKNEAPGCEIISIPGLMSGPSEFVTYSVGLISSSESLTDPPEKGKKYLSVLAAVNHCFSRGTIVSDLIIEWQLLIVF
jgi:hypothetical protein